MNDDNFYECNKCLRSFDNKEKFIKHLMQNHMQLNFSCEECSQKLTTSALYHSHQIKEHGYFLCSNCKLPYRNKEEHRCGEAITAFLCDLDGCRERYYYRLNFFVRHLQVEHKIAEFNTIKYLIENKCKEVIKPYKEPKQQQSSNLNANSPYAKYIDRNEEFDELINYVENNARHELGESGSSSEEESEEENIKEENEEDKKAKSSSKVEYSKGQKDNDHMPMENSNSEPARESFKEDETTEKRVTSSTVLSHLRKREVKPVKENSLAKICQDMEQKADTNEYELLMCNYKDNKRFIKSIKYEDLLLKALALVECLQTRKDIFTVLREARPFKTLEHYDLSEFNDTILVYVRTEHPHSHVFEKLIEKQWRVRTLSKINHKLFEHKKHSNYMLNKRLKLVCCHCDTQFKFFDEFIKHYRLCLLNDIKKIERFMCPICNRYFYNYYGMIQHLEIEHFIL